MIYPTNSSFKIVLAGLLSLFVSMGALASGQVTNQKRAGIEKALRNALSQARSGRFKAAQTLWKNITRDLILKDANTVDAFSIKSFSDSYDRLTALLERDSVRAGKKAVAIYKVDILVPKKTTTTRTNEWRNQSEKGFIFKQKTTSKVVQQKVIVERSRDIISAEIHVEEQPQFTDFKSFGKNDFDHILSYWKVKSSDSESTTLISSNGQKAAKIVGKSHDYINWPGRKNTRVTLVRVDFLPFTPEEHSSWSGEMSSRVSDLAQKLTSIWEESNRGEHFRKGSGNEGRFREMVGAFKVALNTIGRLSTGGNKAAFLEASEIERYLALFPARIDYNDLAVELSREDSSFKKELEKIVGPDSPSNIVDWLQARENERENIFDNLANSLVALYLEGKEDVVEMVLSQLSEQIQMRIESTRLNLDQFADGVVQSIEGPSSGKQNGDLEQLVAAKKLLTEAVTKSRAPEYQTSEKIIKNQIRELKIIEKKEIQYKGRSVVEGAQENLKMALAAGRDAIFNVYENFRRKPSREVRVALLGTINFYHTRIDELNVRSWPYREYFNRGDVAKIPLRDPETGEYVLDENGKKILVEFDQKDEDNKIIGYQFKQGSRIAESPLFKSSAERESFDAFYKVRYEDIELTYFKRYFEEMFVALKIYQNAIEETFEAFVENPSHSVAVLLKQNIAQFESNRAVVIQAIKDALVAKNNSSEKSNLSLPLKLSKNGPGPKAFEWQSFEIEVGSVDENEGPQIRDLQLRYIASVSNLNWGALLDAGEENSSKELVKKIESLRAHFNDLLIGPL